MVEPHDVNGNESDEHLRAVIEHAEGVMSNLLQQLKYCEESVRAGTSTLTGTDHENLIANVDLGIRALKVHGLQKSRQSLGTISSALKEVAAVIQGNSIKKTYKRLGMF